jgi:hypothetical protein
MQDDPTDARHDRDEEEVDRDVVPEDAPRGGTTVPMPNQTGVTTPPITGWGEALIPDNDEPDAPTGER